MGISVQKTNAAILYPCPVMLWILCALSYFAISSDGVKSTCNAGSVRIGEEARITCRFEEDLRKTQHDVRLFYNTTPVLVIAWSDGSPEIHTKPGYQFDGKINDTITLEIPDAKFDQAGLYACHIVLSDADDASPCTLNVTGDWYITTANDPCPAICSTSTGFNNTCISNDNTTFVYNIVIAILTVILGVFVSAFITLYIRQNPKRRVNKKSNLLGEGEERVDKKSNLLGEGEELLDLKSRLLRLSPTPINFESSSLCERPVMVDVESRSSLKSPEPIHFESSSFCERPVMVDVESRSSLKSPECVIKELGLILQNPEPVNFESSSLCESPVLVDVDSRSWSKSAVLVDVVSRISIKSPVVDDFAEFPKSKISERKCVPPQISEVELRPFET